MRLFHQIFLLVALTALLAAAAMAGLAAMSLSRGFEAYLDERDEQRLQEFAAEAENLIGQDRGPGAGSARGIEAAVVLVPNPGGRPPPDRLEQSVRGPRARDNDGPPPVGARPLPPPGFLSRVSLYDITGDKIAGPTAPPDSTALLRRSIMFEGQVVGEAVLLPRGPTPESIETDFLRGQFIGMASLLVSLLVLSAIAAFVLAKRGAKVVSNFQEAAGAIAKGDFSARVSHNYSGEIGELGASINQMADNLGALQQARQTWLAEIGHELRTPLTVLQGELEAVSAGVRPLNQDAVASLAEETDRLSLLVEDLQFLAISDLAKPSYVFAQHEVADLLLATQRRFEPRIKSAGHTVTFIGLEQLNLTANWDRARTEQLMANLLTNAINYTATPGCIRISAKHIGDRIQILVEDSAPGVNASDLKKLFDPLFRVEKSRDRASGGSGLGLSVCAAIVQEHGGTIASGISELGGLKITVSLPLHPAHNTGGSL